MKSHTASQPITSRPPCLHPPDFQAGETGAGGAEAAIILQPLHTPSPSTDHESLIRSDISIGPLLTGLTLLILMRRHR